MGWRFPPGRANGKRLEGAFYTTLVLAAVYWGFKGDFLDFWDAALWLFAFVFIELNVFEWQQEIRDQSVTDLRHPLS